MLLLLGAGCNHHHVSPTESFYSKAELSFQSGNFNQALNEVDQGLRVAGDREVLWRLQLLRAEIFIWQGRDKDAEVLLKSGSFPEPGSDLLVARRSTLLGVAECDLHQLDSADRIFQATEKMQGAASPEVLGDLLLGEGKLAAFRRNPSRSEFLFQRALKVAQGDNQAFLASRALGNLGMLQMQHDHYADGVDLFNASLEKARQVNAQVSMVRTTINLGWAYRRMGDLDRATELFEDSEIRAGKLGMPIDETRAVMSLAIIQFNQHNYSAAKKDYQRALQLARQADDKQETVYCLTDLTQVAIEEGDFDRARSYNKESEDLEQTTGAHDTELYSLENQAQILSGMGDDRSAEPLLKQVIRGTNGNVELQVQALTNLARIDTHRGHIADARRHYVAALGSLEKERQSIGRDELKLSYPTNAKDSYSEYIDFLVGQKLPAEAFRVSELQRARTLTDGLGSHATNFQSFDVAQVERATTRLGHPILSYWIGAKSSYLWLVLAHHTQIFLLPGEEKIRPLTERYRDHLVGALGGDDLANADGLELYRILIGPVEPWIKPDSEVTIISDGPLCGLNFETLVVNAPKPHFWIQDVSITNASSALLLALGSRGQASRPETPARNLLLIGNPQSPPNYPPLSHAGEEMALVGQHFSKEQETVLSGREATPAAYFKAKPENYSLIHFVAHGTASRVSPLDSAVVLSQDGSSYNLYARDIAANRLHAHLVTISACDSAGTRIYSSEGLVGLSWAFLRAGAQRVIASLWEANDASTSKLMGHLYSLIAQGRPPAAALRDAKLTMLQSGGVYSRPFYWAPFVLYQGI